MFFFDPIYMIFMIPAFILMAIASGYVRSAYNKWSRIRATSGLTGAQAAQRLISTGNLYGVQVAGTQGELSDHYDPRNKTLYLSQTVYNSPSVAAVAVAAHELGHAMQDRLRSRRARFRREMKNASHPSPEGRGLRRQRQGTSSLMLSSVTGSHCRRQAAGTSKQKTGSSLVRPGSALQCSLCQRSSLRSGLTQTESAPRQ